MNAGWDSVRARILSKVKVSENGCWLWTGSIDCSGYARIFFRRRNWRASQVTWSAHREEEWPIGKFALHSCDDRKCVNPAHIRPGSNSENIKEAWDRGGLRKFRFKQTCSRGHQMNAENTTYYRSTGDTRHCRTCVREKSIITNARAKARRAERNSA